MKKLIVIVYILMLMANRGNAQCVGEPGQVTWHYWKDIPYYEMDQLYADDTYPSAPDGMRKLNAASNPFHYDDFFGSVLKGFISVPESGPVTFNVTGDDQTLLLLSTDATAGNLDTTAYIEYWTNREEHNKYPSQTYGPVEMIAGQLYYFELHNREQEGGDHASLYWQRPYVSDSTWQLITSPFLTDVCDEVCSPKGTPCDDGNAMTTGDVEDGWCHCMGEIATDIPIGNRGELEIYYYDNIEGGNLSTLLSNPDFPYAPDRMSIHTEGLFAQWPRYVDNYGALIKGYITVPEDGCYDFNVTGVSDVRFSISSDHSPANIIDSIETLWGTNTLEHDHPDFNGSQTMTNVCMNAGQYYYFELKQKVPSWGHRFSVFWKTPYHLDNRWHRIPEVMVYGYQDPIICLPFGSTCDDGNPLTASDRIDNNCNCVGIPCEPFVDCDDPEANFIKYDYCETTDELGTRPDDAWLSCNAGTNPYIPIYSGFHWIHYDLGSQYELHNTRVWNYNVTDQTHLGFQQTVVHYSVDGTTWQRLGTYTWELASGTNNYSGFDGPNFDGITARYIIFTCLDQSNECRGISKITFDANLCQPKGTACDDGDMATYNDVFDDNCQCRGLTPAEMDCVIDTLYLYQEELANNQYHAINALMSNGRVMNASDINYKAGLEIVLNAGFEIDLGSSLEATIEDCPSSSIAIVESSVENLKSKAIHPLQDLDVYALQEESIQTIRVYIAEPMLVKLELLDEQGNWVAPIITHSYADKGDHYKRIETKKLKKGVYIVRMTTTQGSILRKMVVL